MASRLKRLFALLLLILLVVFAFSGCFRRKNDFSKVNDDKVFHYILYGEEPETVQIYSLDAYKLNNDYYYHVRYSYITQIAFLDYKPGDRVDLDMVYFGSWIINNHFNLNWEDFGDMAKYRDAYYEAVEKGAHRPFSQEEIQRRVDDYFASRE